jgi:DNA-directed RNA polymerase
MEQRTITQSVRDINTIMKVVNESNKSHNPQNSSQITAMQAVHANMQNEMEIKLLREERRSLSESLAQINVDRIKLTEDKLSFERQKMEFERERHRVLDIEAKSKARIAEAQEIKEVNK